VLCAVNPPDFTPRLTLPYTSVPRAGVVDLELADGRLEEIEWLMSV